MDDFMTLRAHPLVAPAEPRGATSDVHPLLANAFAELDSARLRWCLLRGRDRLMAPPGDVDLLVGKGERIAAVEALLRAGFAVRRLWAHGTQNFLIAYHRDTDLWLNLHLVAVMAFGDCYALDFGVTSAVLARCVREGNVPMPARDDRFWITLLHALLDKRTFAPKYRNALQELVGDARTDGRLAAACDHILAEMGGAPGAIRDVREGVWDRLEDAARSDLAERLVRRDPAALARLVRHRTSLVAKKIREIATHRGISVVLLAPEGAGKSTLADSLRTGLHFSARRLDFAADDAGESSAPRSALRAPFRAARAAWIYLLSLYHRARRRFVAFDGYPREVLAEPRSGGRAAALERALLGHLLPWPDVVLFLDAPSDVLHSRNRRHAVEALERRRRAFLDLARRLPRATVLDATRAPGELKRDAVDAVWRVYRARHQKL